MFTDPSPKRIMAAPAPPPTLFTPHKHTLGLTPAPLHPARTVIGSSLPSTMPDTSRASLVGLSRRANNITEWLAKDFL